MPSVQVVPTADGSYTLETLAGKECYHSTNGALQESQHVFIDAGLKMAKKEEQLNILEVGFGTGLNALLTLLEAEKNSCKIYYEAVEKYPISIDTANKLNYCEMLRVDKEHYFYPLHACPWGVETPIMSSFILKKCKADLLSFTPSRNRFKLVYFDAFSPDSQPELWSVGVLSKIYQHMQSEGVLVTYSSKGIVKQNLRSVGFIVERLAGAKGKRHMLRAIKR